MNYEASSPQEYINQLPQDRKNAIEKLRKIIKENLPKGFEETMAYGMISYVVPHSIYPQGYHVNSKEPLPFIAIALCGSLSLRYLCFSGCFNMV